MKTRDWIALGVLAWLLWPKREEVTVSMSFPEESEFYLSPIMEGLCRDVFGRVDYCTRMDQALIVEGM